MEKGMARGRQSVVGEGNSEIWDLKYKDGHYLEIRLKNCKKNHIIHNLWAKIDKGGERIMVF